MWQGCTSAAGFRIFGTSVWRLRLFAELRQHSRSGFQRPLTLASWPLAAISSVYGDADIAAELGLAAPQGTFEEGLRRCLNVAEGVKAMP